MNSRVYLFRSLRHFWRTHLAVVAGVATAVSVLGGALVVGDSVRASLRALALQRLGRAEHAVVSGGFFRTGLADALARTAGGPGAPLVALGGTATHEESGRRAGRVLVYGVDERFWAFHGVHPPPLAGRDALLSRALADELGALGSTILVRVEGPGDVPAGTLYGRKDALGRTLRLNARAVLATQGLGEFSLRPTQQAVRAVFVPLGLLQRTLDRPDEANTILLAGASDPASALRRAALLEDLGLRLRALPDPRALSLESEAALLDDAVAEAARAAAQTSGLRAQPVLTYLANALRANGREVPYSVVTALAPEHLAALGASVPDPTASPPPIVLNDWAAEALAARPGDALALDYYVWLEAGRLETRTAEFRVASAIPLAGAAADPDLTPSYPGITGSESLGDWDPPFPIDLSRVTPRDEAYWDAHRTTPKAFIPLAAGQALWRHRLGALTSLRISVPEGRTVEDARAAFAAALAERLDPARQGLRVEAVRAEALAAAQGATDFGEYFAYFSAFLVASALLLAGLFFRLGLEQRLTELGLLRAVGFPPAWLRRHYLVEGGALAALGSVLGMAGAAGYAALVLFALRTWWVDAVGTQALTLHVTPRALLLGALGGLAASVAVVLLTLRGLGRRSPRALLAGTLDAARARRTSAVARAFPALAGVVALALLAAALSGAVGQTGAFFAAGFLLLAGALAALRLWLVRTPRGEPRLAAGPAWLGLRNAAYRPGRTVLCVALVAFAAFVIVAVGAFRRDPSAEDDPRSGTGGYALVAESLLPLHHDPATAEGREALNLAGSELDGVRFARFRLRPGDDASCLNLYRPQDPRVIAPEPAFLSAGRFAFQSSLAATAAERENPWLLLGRDLGDAIPAVVDANSMTYVLHRKLGDEIVIDEGGRPVRLCLVAALRDSLFQGELIVGEAAFLRSFPAADGYRFFLIEAPRGHRGAVIEALESRLADFGLDAAPAGERLAAFHRVENTYLSTFQTLGALGLLLGTVGLATVLLRNALERRRELALLRAVGYRERHLTAMVIAENGLMLALGLGIGTSSALLAVAPAVAARGGQFPLVALLGLLAAVLLTGLAVSRLAVAAVHRAPLLASLRAE